MECLCKEGGGGGMIKGWTQRSELAVLPRSLTKVWISQLSTATVHPSTSSPPATHYVARAQTKRQRWSSSSPVSITTNTQQPEREADTDHDTHQQLVMRSGFMADPRGGGNRPGMGNNPSTFTACVVTEFRVEL